MDLPTAAAQAREALALGTSGEEVPAPSFYSFSDYYAKYLLQELKKTGVVKMAASPVTKYSASMMRPTTAICVIFLCNF